MKGSEDKSYNTSSTLYIAAKPFRGYTLIKEIWSPVQSAYWCITRLVLPSPIETVARDLEAQTLAFSAPSCRLLLLQGTLRQLMDCIIRFRYTKGCSNKLPNLIFWITLFQTHWKHLSSVGKMKYSSLKSTKAVARAKYVSCRSKFSGDLAQENGQLSGSVCPCFSRTDRLPIFSRDSWPCEKLLIPAFMRKITRGHRHMKLTSIITRKRC